MAESIAVPATPVPPRRALHFDWVFPVLFRPRQAFTEIAAQTRGVWLTPLLILTVSALMSTLMQGYVNSISGTMGGTEIREDFFFTPEQQAQLQQAMEATQGPVFVYVLPAFVTIFAVWGGWLILGSILHLILTLMGGRSTTGITMNIVAWASLPLAVRSLLQFLYLLITRMPIDYPGQSGWLPQGDSVPLVIAASCLALFDLFLIWQIILLVIGVRASSALTLPRAIVSVLLTLGIILILQTAIGYAGSLLSSLTVIRPFF